MNILFALLFASQITTALIGDLGVNSPVVTNVSFDGLATTQALVKFATTNDLARAIEDFAAVESDAPSAPSPYLRTDSWRVSYAQLSGEDLTSEIAENTVVNGYNISRLQFTATSEMKAEVKGFTIPDDEEIAITNLVVLSGNASVANGNVVSLNENMTNTLITARACGINGEVKVANIALSRGQKRYSLLSYDSDAGDTMRKRVNDYAMFCATNSGIMNSAIRADGQASNSLDRVRPCNVYEKAYFTAGAKGAGHNPAFPLPKKFVSLAVWNSRPSAYVGAGDPWRQGGSANAGRGASYVVGRHLVGHAAHWGGSYGKSTRFFVMRTNGELVELHHTGYVCNLTKFARDMFGEENFRETFGYDCDDLTDIILHEVAEEIPDDCVPYLMRYEDAKEIFGEVVDNNSNNEGALDLKLSGWSIGQNNSIYPTWISTDSKYSGGGVGIDIVKFSRRDGDSASMTLCRRDWVDVLDGAWWKTINGDSGKPSFFIYNKRGEDMPILIGEYHYVASGGSFLKAFPVIEILEQYRGRNPAESLKIFNPATDL